MMASGNTGINTEASFSRRKQQQTRIKNTPP